MPKDIMAQNNVISFIPKRKRTQQIVEDAKEVFRMQAASILNLTNKIGNDYAKAVKLLLDTKGHVIVCGMGKSGLVGQKIAATLASTGTPSFFLHAAEAFHGDLGMITENDSIILISNSGETEEVIKLLPFIKKNHVPTIALTGKLHSTLAKHSDVALDISVEREACPNNLAPTNSTMTTMSMGDSLAVSLINERNFQSHDFAKFHPGGNLGRCLITQVKEIMHKGNLPIVNPNQSVQDSLITITQGRLGLALVMDGDDLLGIFTDGDLRRAVQRHNDLSNVPIKELMSSSPKAVYEDTLVGEAEELMMNEKIKALVVYNKHGKVSGILEIFDD